VNQPHSGLSKTEYDGLKGRRPCFSVSLSARISRYGRTLRVAGVELSCELLMDDMSDQKRQNITKNEIFEDDVLVYKQDHLLVRARWRIVTLAGVFTITTLVLLPLFSQMLFPVKQDTEKTEQAERDRFSIRQIQLKETQKSSKIQQLQNSRPRSVPPRQQNQTPAREKTSREPLSHPEIAPDLSEPKLNPRMDRREVPDMVRPPAPEASEPVVASFPVESSKTDVDSHKASAAKTAGEKATGSGNSDEPYASAALDASPTPVVQTQPSYPYTAKRRGTEGFVQLRFVVTGDGRVRDPKVVASEPESVFDQAALNCVRNWRFKPGEKNGEKVSTYVEIKIRFRLQ